MSDGISSIYAFLSVDGSVVAFHHPMSIESRWPASLCLPDDLHDVPSVELAGGELVFGNLLQREGDELALPDQADLPGGVDCAFRELVEKCLEGGYLSRSEEFVSAIRKKDDDL